MIDRAEYPSPVSKLIDHGPVKERVDATWFDYVGHYQLGEMDVPVLIELMYERDIDVTSPAEMAAPVHACRALGQFGDIAAIDALVGLFIEDENDELISNAQVALCMFGAPSLSAMKRFFLHPKTSPGSQIRTLEGIEKLAQTCPQVRDEAVQFLMQGLAHYRNYKPDVNGFLVHYLVELKATEAAGVMKKAMKSGRVSKDLYESWDEVKAELGMG